MEEREGKREREKQTGRKRGLEGWVGGWARGERMPRINATARPGGQNLRIPAGYIDATQVAIHDRGVPIVDLKRADATLSLKISPPSPSIFNQKRNTSDQIRSIFRERIVGTTGRASSALTIIKSIRTHQVI